MELPQQTATGQGGEHLQLFRHQHRKVGSHLYYNKPSLFTSTRWPTARQKPKIVLPLAAPWSYIAAPTFRR